MRPAEDVVNEIGAHTSSGLAPALELLVRSLPAVGSPMSKDRREQWLQMARATLAFVYPEELPSTPESISQEEDHGDDEA